MSAQTKIYIAAGIVHPRSDGLALRLHQPWTTANT